MIFVYFNDDWADSGGIGLEAFVSKDEAADYIAKRIKGSTRKPPPTIENYVVIEGQKLTPRVVEVATKVII